MIATIFVNFLSILTIKLLYKKDIFFSMIVARDYASDSLKKRAMGIEPTSLAWEARVLPLDYARI